jgi:hypothetical protein
MISNGIVPPVESRGFVCAYNLSIAKVLRIGACQLLLSGNSAHNPKPARLSPITCPMVISQQFGCIVGAFRLNLHQSRSQPTKKYQPAIKNGIADRKVVSWLTPSVPRVLINILAIANAGNAETASTIDNSPGSTEMKTGSQSPGTTTAG